MRYLEIQPKPWLAQYVECFWTLESEASAARVSLDAPEPMQPERILPDGCVELILNFGEQFRELLDNGQQEPQPMHFLVGQMTRPMLISPDGRVELIGIRFHPGGTLPFFRLDMHEATNRVVELAALSRDLERKLVSRMDETRALSSLALKIVGLEKLLAELVRNYKHDSWVPDLAARIVQTGGQVSIDGLANGAGVSSRQLERRFLKEVGIGPKLLCRILRFQQIFRALDRNDAGWAGLAADCGYYDQAHLIHDFQQFARQTPAALFENRSKLTESFTRKHRASDFYNTSA